MPLWQIFHPKGSFSDADKHELAKHITGVYENFLPRFYVNVLFHEVKKPSFYVGGEPVDDFVRVSVDHIARSTTDAKKQQQFLKSCARLLDPFVAKRGLRWELHVDETPFDFWTINGYKPPLPNTPAEVKWRSENKPSSYEAA